MACKLIDGKKVAEKIKRSLKRDIAALALRGGRLKLAAVAMGRNPASEVYLSRQKKLADELGVEYNVKYMAPPVSQEDAEREISLLNKDDSVSGIIVQMPVPKNIKGERLLAKIAPHKDAEGLNVSNIGKLTYGNWAVAPCAAGACMALIDASGIKLKGREAVIVGHSAIVGKPLSLMLLSRFATTTVCHVGTYERGRLAEHVKKAEILIVAVGKRGLIKGSWVRRGAVVIDVGINKTGGRITGDVDFEGARKRAAYITPVPGGVGPVTAVMLMKNLLELYKAKPKNNLLTKSESEKIHWRH